MSIVCKSRLIFCCLFIFSFLCSPTSATPSVKVTEIDSILDVLKKSFPNKAEISEAIIKNGTVNFLGFKREKRNWIPIDNHESIFEIGSITKVFTSTLLSHAVHQGVVGLDTPITSVSDVSINDAVKEGHPITMLSLSNHTSGLPRLPSNLVRSIIVSELMSAYIWPFGKRNGNPYYGYNEKKFNTYLRKGIKLKSVPETTFSYSNLGAALLGYLLTKKLGTDYESLLQNEIFIPLGMKSTTTKRERVADRLVQARNSAGRKVKNWDLYSMEAAGAVLSSTGDLVRFAFANMEPDSILSYQRELTFSNEKDSVALGWFIMHYANGGEYVWHNGGTGGYSSSMAVDSNHRNAVVLLTNVGGKNDALDSACANLMEYLLAEKG